MRLRDVRAHGHNGKAVEALDAADASASDVEQDFGVALAELAAQALRQVDQALARLEHGDYGLCRDCTEKISRKRLQALPFALRCRECEELRESSEQVRRFSARNDDLSLPYEGRLQRFGPREWE